MQLDLALLSCFVVPILARSGPFHIFDAAGDVHISTPNQVAMTDNDPSAEVSTGVFLSDVIGKEQQIAIFSSLTRDISTVASRLEDTTLNATVLAPSNTAMKALPRKPWEDPADYKDFGTNAYSGQSGSDRAQENLKRFVEAHIVPDSPWAEGEKIKTMGGGEVWWTKEGGVKIIQPGGVKVTSVADKVGNGEVWVLDGVINYSQS